MVEGATVQHRARDRENCGGHKTGMWESEGAPPPKAVPRNLGTPRGWHGVDPLLRREHFNHVSGQEVLDFVLRENDIPILIVGSYWEKWEG